jgi:hypothetical protein
METDLDNVSLLAEVHFQMQVIKPVVEKLRKEFGEEKAIQLIRETLHEYYKKLYMDQAASIKGSTLEKWEGMNAEMRRRRGDNCVLNVEVVEQNKRSVKLKVTKCGYAEFFKSIGEPELGVIMGCDRDHHVVNAAGHGLIFNRKHTIMEGADHCDFNYIFVDKIA